MVMIGFRILLDMAKPEQAMATLYHDGVTHAWVKPPHLFRTFGHPWLLP